MKGNARIRLQEQPFQILQLLLARAGAVITRDEITMIRQPAGIRPILVLAGVSAAVSVCRPQTY